MQHRLLKWTARTVIGLMLLNVLPFQALAAAPANSEAAGPARPARVELTQRRSATARHYREENGKMTMEIFAAPIHFRDEQGNWQEIDDRLIPAAAGSGVFGWQNRANAFRSLFARESNGQIARVENGGHYAGWTVKGLNRVPGTARENRVTYSQVLPGVDLQYQVTSGGVKEEFIVTDDDTPHTYIVEIDTDLKTEPAGGGLQLADEAGKVVMTVPAPFARDAGGAVSPAELVSLGSGRYELRVDELWFRHPDRVFPIVIDPSIVTMQPNATSGMDTTISQAAAAVNFGGDEFLKVGRNGGNESRSLLKFNISEIPPGATVEGASLILRRAAGISNTGDHTYGLYEVLTDWLEAEATWQNARASRTWGNPGGDYAATAIGSVTLSTNSGAANTDARWNVKAQVAGMLLGANRGFLVRSPDAGNTELNFVSSDSLDQASRPKLQILYSEDVTPPSVTIMDAASLSGTAAEFYAYVSDSTPGSGVDRVEFFVDGGLVGTVRTPDNLDPTKYVLKLDTTRYPNETYLLDVRAYDKAGNLGQMNRAILIDSFAGGTEYDAVLRDGAVSLMSVDLPLTTGAPTSSAEKVAEAHGLDLLKDTCSSPGTSGCSSSGRNVASYWKSAGRESADGIESFVVTFPSSYTIVDALITPARSADRLIARIELLDDAGSPVNGSVSWAPLYDDASPQTTEFRALTAAASATKARVSFTNLAYDQLTGRYHANVADVRLQYRVTDSYYWVDHYRSEYSYLRSCVVAKDPEMDCSLLPESETVTAWFASLPDFTESTPKYSYQPDTISVTPQTGVTYTGQGGTYQLTYPAKTFLKETDSYNEEYAESPSAELLSTYKCTHDCAGDWQTWTAESWATDVFSISTSLCSYCWRKYWGPLRIQWGPDFPLNTQATLSGKRQWDVYTYPIVYTTKFEKVHYRSDWDYDYYWFPPENMTLSGAAYVESNGAANLTDSPETGTRWVGITSTAMPTGTAQPWLEIPLTGVQAINAVSFDPQYEGMTATITVLNGTSAERSLTIPDLRRGTYTFDLTYGDRIRVELTKLVGSGTSYYAALKDVRPRYVEALTEGTYTSTSELLSGATELMLDVTDWQPAGTGITYALRLDSMDFPVTPGVPFKVPGAPSTVAIVATLTGDGIQSPVLYRWRLSTKGSTRSIAFSNPTAGDVFDPAPVSLQATPDAATGIYTLTASTTLPGVTAVDFLVDGMLLGSDTTSPYTYTWASASAPPGVHIFRAEVKGAGGKKVGGAGTYADLAGEAPGNLLATASQDGKVTLTWLPPSGTGPFTYNVYRYTTPGGSPALIGSASELTYTDPATGLTVGQTYYYQVRALSGATEGRPSRLKAAVIGAPLAGLDRFGLERFYPYVQPELFGTESYVNVTNGNLVTQVADFGVPTPGFMMLARRSLNSLPASSAEPPRWRWNHEIQIRAESDAAILTNSDGAVYRFPKIGTDVYGRPAGVYMWLTGADGQFTIAHRDGLVWYFDSANRLAKTVDRNGNYLTYEYRSGETVVADSAGRTITYTLDTADRITQAKYDGSDAVRTVTYSYDTRGDMVGVRDLAGYQWTYLYDADHRLVGVVTPAGILWSVMYDYQGRVAAIVDPLGNTAAMAYASGSSTLTDPRGNPTTFTFSGQGQLTERSATVGGQTIAVKLENYDSDFNPQRYVSGSGDIWTTTYDGRGHVTSVTEPKGARTEHVYDSDPGRADQLIEVRRPMGIVERTSYDARGNRIRISQSALGQPEKAYQRFTYYANGQLASHRDMWGGISHFEYDAYGNLTERTNQAGEVTRLEQYVLGAPQVQTDPTGAVTRFGYDGAGRRTLEIAPDGSRRRTVYTSDGLVRTTTDYNGNATVYRYDRAARPSSVWTAAGTVTYAYDANGNRTEVGEEGPIPIGDTNPQIWKTTYTYDEANRLLTEARGSNVQTYAYDQNDNLSRVTNPRTNTLDYTYDHAGRVTKAVIAKGLSEEGTSLTLYDLRGRKAAEIDPVNHKVGYVYDDLDRLIEVRENLLTGDQFAANTAAPYQKVGNHTPVSQAYLGETAVQIKPSAPGDGVQVIIPFKVRSGQTLTVGLSGAGSGSVDLKLWDDTAKNSQVLTDFPLPADGSWAEMPAFRFTYNGADTEKLYLQVLTRGQTVYLDDFEVAQSSFTRYSDFPVENACGTTAASPCGYTVTATDAMGRASTVTYDLLGRVIGASDPLGNTRRTEYRTADNQKLSWDAKGNKTVYHYNLRGWLSSVQYADGSKVGYTYDANGNRLSMEDSLGQTLYQYDGANRLTRLQDPFGRVTTQTYSGAALVQQSNLVGTVTYSYNTLRQAREMSLLDSKGTVLETTAFAYNPAGSLYTQTTGNNKVTWEYDRAERLSYVLGDYAGAKRYKGTYGYDAASHRTTYTWDHSDAGVTTYTFGYDSLQRLVRTDESNGTYRTYQYDSVGNRLLRTEGKGTTENLREEYTYDAGNRLNEMKKTASGKVETTTYEYDLNGNQTRVTEPTGITSFTYDMANRLVGASLPSGFPVVHRYDGDGNRLYTLDSSIERYFLLNGGNVVADLDGAGAVIASYLRAPGGRLVSTRQRTGTYFYHADGVGSVVGLVNTSGGWDSWYQYDEFGVAKASSGSAWNNFRFTGAQFSQSTGLYHMGAREYNPFTGRFITQDSWKGSPWLPWTQNLYSYVGNSPLNYVDPTGHTPELLLNLAMFMVIRGLLTKKTAFGAVLANNVVTAPLGNTQVFNSFHETAQLFVGKAVYDAGLGRPSLEVPVTYTDPATGQVSTKSVDVQAGINIWEVKPEIKGVGGVPSIDPNPQLNIYTQFGGYVRGPALSPIDDILITPELKLYGLTVIPKTTMHINFPAPGVATYGFDMENSKGKTSFVGSYLAASAVLGWAAFVGGVLTLPETAPVVIPALGY